MRSARKLVAVVSSAALIGAGALLTAAPAHAAPISVTDAACTAGTGTPVPGAPISAAAGDTINITATLTLCDAIYVSTSLVSGVGSITYSGGGTVTDNSSGPFYVLQGNAAFTSVSVLLSSSATTGGIGLYNLSVSPGNGDGTDWNVGINGGGSSSSSAAGNAPAPVIQQFGKPASGTCEEAAPADLNVAGVGSGGWGTSWAQWMNNGAGGAVCTRTLSYVSGAWTVS